MSNIKTIEGLDHISEYNEELHIGILTKLKDFVASDLIKKIFSSIVEAAESGASPLIRNQVTIGGKLVVKMFVAGDIVILTILLVALIVFVKKDKPVTQYFVKVVIILFLKE